MTPQPDADIVFEVLNLLIDANPGIRAHDLWMCAHTICYYL